MTTLPEGCTTECRHASMDTRASHERHASEGLGMIHTQECLARMPGPCTAGQPGSNCRVGLAAQARVLYAPAPHVTLAECRMVPLADLHTLRVHLMFVHGWLVGHGNRYSQAAKSIRFALDILADTTGGTRTSAERSKM